MLALIIIIALKFLVPPFLLLYPFQAAWLNYFLDVVDGDLLHHFGMEENTYQLIDKLADYYSYVFMLLLGLRWRIRKTIIILFAYRTIGQMLFFLTGAEIWFLYFQNFLEPLVMIYALILFKQKSEEKTFQTYKKHFLLIWSIILIYKLWNEWYLHLANIDLSTMLFGING